MNSTFNHKQYRIRKKVLTLVGAKFHVYDTSDRLLLFSQMKAFKLKEDIRLYGDESMREELITIKARSVIDFSATYDVVDTITGEQLGSLRRKGMKSILKDEWVILSPNEVEVGLIKEDSRMLAFIRRAITNLVPQTFNVVMNDRVVTVFKQNFNPFVSKLDVDFSLDTANKLDRRLGLAAGMLLLAIEGNQG